MDLPSGTVTFLFTDIEGSTRLWQNAPDAMRKAVARHDVLLKEAVENHDGIVFKTTGDGIAAAFVLAPDALAAALAAQQALLAEPWPETTVIRARMGIHTGAAELRDGDYFGSTLSRCARIMAAGHGGQSLLSEAAQELARDTLPPGVRLQPLGEHRLKDLARPETLHQLMHAALPTDFPPLRSLDQTPNNLPQQVTSFIGREKPLAEVAALMDKTRLLTLVGSGGSGKSRLSLQTAAHVLEQFPDGVWLVEFAPLADPALIPQAVAGVLNVKEEAGKTLTTTLGDALKARKLLLVLDNCEHVLPACAALAASLLRACPQVKMLATSREALGIGGETLYRIPTLTLPDPKRSKEATPESLSQFESVRLFIERAQAVKPDFAVTNTSAPALAQLCYRLDGIPLAIELAAARTRSLAIEQINDKLDSRFRLLTGGDKSALPRQQTLKALVDWSYDLLGVAEKTLLARLSVFAGGWTLEAAESVCSFEPVEDWEVLDLLTSLADKSLVVVEEDEEASETRCRMLETIRQYGAEKLSARGEPSEVSARHADYFVALAETAKTALFGPDQARWFSRLEQEHDNFRAIFAACADAVEKQMESAPRAALLGLRLAGALPLFWELRGYRSEGREQVRRALLGREVVLASHADKVTAKKAVAGALSSAGIMMSPQNAADAQTLLQECLALYREAEDKPNIALTLSYLGEAFLWNGDPEGARPLFEEGLALSRERGDKIGIARILFRMGASAYFSVNHALVRFLSLGESFSSEDYALARSLYEESRALYQEVGNLRNVADADFHLGSIAANQRDYALAQSLVEKSLVLSRKAGASIHFPESLALLGCVALYRGDDAQARLHLEEALALLRKTDDSTLTVDVLKYLGHAVCSQGDFARARSLYEKSLRLACDLQDNKGIAWGLESIASADANTGEARRASVLWAAAAAMRESLGVPLSLNEQARHDKALATVRSLLDEAEGTAAQSEGRAMPWEQAVALALRDTP